MGISKKAEECDTGNRDPIEGKSEGNLKDGEDSDTSRSHLYGNILAIGLNVQKSKLEYVRSSGREFFKKNRVKVVNASRGVYHIGEEFGDK